MNVSTKLLSTLSAAAITLGTVSPAFAYIVESKASRTQAAKAAEQANYLWFNQRHDRPLTRRSIRGNRNQNSVKHRVGSIRVRGGERSAAEADDTGRTRLPVRATWRQPFLRNQNRHHLGNRRGGWSQVNRRQRDSVSSGSGPILYRLPTRPSRRQLKEYQGSLPPVLVQTGARSKHPNWRRYARGGENGSRVRNINGLNRR